jgi:hypothetical protein
MVIDITGVCWIRYVKANLTPNLFGAYLNTMIVCINRIDRVILLLGLTWSDTIVRFNALGLTLNRS